MAVLLIADVNNGALATDQVAKATAINLPRLVLGLSAVLAAGLMEGRGWDGRSDSAGQPTILGTGP